jgi:hypothetical protein
MSSILLVCCHPTACLSPLRPFPAFYIPLILARLWRAFFCLSVYIFTFYFSVLPLFQTTKPMIKEALEINILKTFYLFLYFAELFFISSLLLIHEVI